MSVIVLTLAFVLMNFFSGIYYSHWLYLRQIFVFVLVVGGIKFFQKLFIKKVLLQFLD
jgi:hypothetical protein